MVLNRASDFSLADELARVLHAVSGPHRSIATQVKMTIQLQLPVLSSPLLAAPTVGPGHGDKAGGVWCGT